MLWLHHIARPALPRPTARVAAAWSTRGRIARWYHSGPAYQRSMWRRGTIAATTPSPMRTSATTQRTRRIAGVIPRVDPSYASVPRGSSAGFGSWSRRVGATTGLRSTQPPRGFRPSCEPRVRARRRAGRATACRRVQAARRCSRTTPWGRCGGVHRSRLVPPVVGPLGCSGARYETPDDTGSTGARR